MPSSAARGAPHPERVRVLEPERGGHSAPRGRRAPPAAPPVVRRGRAAQDLARERARVLGVEVHLACGRAPPTARACRRARARCSTLAPASRASCAASSPSTSRLGERLRADRHARRRSRRSPAPRRRPRRSRGASDVSPSARCARTKRATNGRPARGRARRACRAARRARRGAARARRAKNAASARSCVTSTTVLPSSREDRAQVRLQLRARDRIERAERLVEQQDLRLEEQRAHEAHALRLPAGELVRESARARPEESA